jgi:PHD/YefM family antitoxin component YafN of YafNO toxin-antitoxin module
MVRISAGDCQRQWGRVQDLAIAEPVTITCNGRDHMVLMSTEEYSRLKRRDREVLRLEDFTEADLQAIRQAEPPAEAAAFDHEVTG